MPRKRSNRSRRRPRRRARRAGTEDPEKFFYSGPTVPRGRALQQIQTKIVSMVWEFTLSSTSAGGINTVIVNNPSNAANWSSVSTGWDEYRTLSVHLAFYPISEYSTATGTIVKAPLALVIDKDSSAPLSSYTGAAAYESVKVKSMEKRFNFVYRASGEGDSIYQNTASVTTTSWIKMFSGGNTVSTAMGIVLATYMVEFRGII